jgi:hypothetical protein
MLLAAAACASSPDIAGEAPVAVSAVAADESWGDFVPDRIVDANELVARAPPPIICREVLKQNSNVHIRQCRTAEEWKRWQAREAAHAAEIVRMMQGSAYR